MPTGRMARYMSQVTALYEQLYRDYRKLTPPAQDRPHFRAFLSTLAQSVREMKRLRRFIAVNEPRAYAALRHERPRLHVPVTPETIKHPTGAILAEAMSIPAFRKYVNGLVAEGRSTAANAKREMRLMKELGLTCN